MKKIFRYTTFTFAAILLMIGILFSLPAPGGDSQKLPSAKTPPKPKIDSLKVDSLPVLKPVKLKRDSLKDSAKVNANKKAMPLPFGVGEKLEFDVSFEFVIGGHAIMEVESIQKFDGHDCYVIVSSARSTRTVDFFYKVKDRIESWRDVDGGFSRQFVKNLREGSHEYSKRVEYHPVDSVGFLFEKKSPKIPDTLEVIGEIQDVLGAFYELRTRPLYPDSSVWIDVHDIRDRYQLEIRIHDRERIEVPAGTFDCFRIEPLLESSGLFRKEGDMEIWITDDEYRIPVLMKSWLYFGRVFAKLTRYRLAEIEKPAKVKK